MKHPRSPFAIKLPFLLSIAIAAGVFIGATMFGKSSNSSKNGDPLKLAIKYRDILNYIDQNYVDTVNTTELVDYSITKMLEKLDPHSVYIPAQEVEAASQELKGSFEGVGIEFSLVKDTIYVVAPISGGPSESVGIKSGDKIIKVNDENVAGVGITNKGVFDRLRGSKGSKVRLKILRKEMKELLSFEITRDKIPQFSIDVSYMVDHKTGYIKMSHFSSTTYDEFRKALTELTDQGMTQLMLDLRDNPGGLLDRAIRICDELLAEGNLIVYTKSKDGRFDERFEATDRGSFQTQPIIVLMNEGSASASEIVSGAIQDNDRGLIVGRRSFGKGLVQLPINLTDGSELRLTISRYYTPSGRSIQKPYTSGKLEDYEMEVYKRFKHGELFTADSTKFNDSLKYYTKKGRIVYGGGGIMPDYFVPRDTSMISKYLISLVASNNIREFALNYAFKNKKSLEKMKYDNFLKNFQVTDQLLKEIIQLGEKNKVEFKKEEFEQSKEFIKNQVKAIIARTVWGNKQAYPIFHQLDHEFQEALKLFDKTKTLLDKK